MKTLTEEQIEIIQGKFGEALGVDHSVTLILCDMALEYLKCREDAERWRKARTIFSIEDIERANLELRGNCPTEEENLKADAAIDAARKEGA